MKIPGQGNSQGPWQNQHVSHLINRRIKNLSPWYQSWSNISKCFCLRKKGIWWKEHICRKLWVFPKSLCAHFSCTIKFSTKGEKNPLLLISIQTVNFLVSRSGLISRKCVVDQRVAVAITSVCSLAYTVAITDAGNGILSGGPAWDSLSFPE